jgi:galactose mutarotase-like enzyme
MSAQRFYASWLGQPAITLENEIIRLTCVPGMGGKIVQLLDKRGGYEWLVEAGERPFHPVEYGAVFTRQDMSGWDEMFPTIDADTYPRDGKFRGSKLPDHGEVWSIPWDLSAEKDRIALTVEGLALPYVFERTITFLDADTLRFDYRVTNKGDEGFIYLWAAHPQFRATPHLRIRLNEAVNEVCNAYPRPLWGDHGMRHTFPAARAADGQVYALDRRYQGDEPACHKVYVPPERPIYSAALADEMTGYALHLRWTQPVCYLGILVDTRMFNAESVIALEPSTSFYDSLTRACKMERTPLLAAHEQHTWSLDLQFTHSQDKTLL